MTSYQAQLLSLPREIGVLERVALHTVMRLPYNTFRHADFFQIDKMCKIRFRSLVAACASALFRTAYKTVTSWPRWVSQLDTAAREFLPVQQFTEGVRSPPCWDSPPIALNLRDAYCGFLGDSRWKQGAEQVIQKLAADNLGVCPVPGDVTVCSKPLQKMIYSRFMDTFFRVDFKDILSKRLRNIFSPYDIGIGGRIDLDECIKIVSSFKTADSIKIIKTWANGWTTSYRMHENPRLPCLFGCAGCKDDQTHYVQCPNLFALNKFFNAGESSDPLVRLGLVETNVHQLMRMCCTFSAYHAIHHQARMHVINSNLDFTNCHFRHFRSVFAEAFEAEARKCSLTRRRFSLQQFDAFLATGFPPSSCKQCFNLTT